MRRLLELVLLCAAASCGGKIDDGTDASTSDGGVDAKSDVAMKPDTSPPPPPPPSCEPDSFPCKSPTECCSNMCNLGMCGPPPPPCKTDGTPCSSDTECCSNACDGTCGTQIGCATTSNKKCDLCVAANCCKDMVACQGDATCSTWLSCVQSCEQQGQSAFACSQAQTTCGPPSGVAEDALFKCAQQFCGSACTVD